MEKSLEILRHSSMGIEPGPQGEQTVRVRDGQITRLKSSPFVTPDEFSYLQS